MNARTVAADRYRTGPERSQLHFSRPRYGRGVMRVMCAVTIGAVLSGFAFLLLTGRYIDDGPVLVSLTAHHGLHEGDLFVIGGWALAMAALVALVSRGRPSTS